MIGAMPAVAVRHERRRGEKRGCGRRPSQLPLQIGRPLDPDGTPSPDRHRYRTELYICGRVAALHAVVGSLLLGIVVLVVGLVQLSPGAEAAQHRYYLMGCGAGLLGIGIIGAILRCVCLHWYNREFRTVVEAPVAQAKQHGTAADTKQTHSQDKHTHVHERPTPDKPKIRPQVSVGKEVDLLIKQASASSDT